jgi:hypothetical protein
VFSEAKLGSIWLQYKVNYGPILQNSKNPSASINKQNVAYVDIKSHNLSDMVIKMHKIARGSFLSILKFYPIEAPKP